MTIKRATEVGVRPQGYQYPVGLTANTAADTITTFNSPGTFTSPSTQTVELLVIGGGGGSGNGSESNNGVIYQYTNGNTQLPLSINGYANTGGGGSGANCVKNALSGSPGSGIGIIYFEYGFLVNISCRISRSQL